ncbi:MAG: hypothetical protein J3K34DRAFT_448679 [Monoraphidium minutum]|nr:MAG: hypothetical protein J3K34DRAFT_448679 [Monoraphidium minutum]
MSCLGCFGRARRSGRRPPAPLRPPCRAAPHLRPPSYRSTPRLCRRMWGGIGRMLPAGDCRGRHRVAEPWVLGVSPMVPLRPAHAASARSCVCFMLQGIDCVPGVSRLQYHMPHTKQHLCKQGGATHTPQPDHVLRRRSYSMRFAKRKAHACPLKEQDLRPRRRRASRAQGSGRHPPGTKATQRGGFAGEGGKEQTASAQPPGGVQGGPAGRGPHH